MIGSYTQFNMNSRDLTLMDVELIRAGVAFDMDDTNDKPVKDYIQSKLFPFVSLFEEKDWLGFNISRWYNSLKSMRRVCFKSDIELNINSWLMPFLAEEIKKRNVGLDAQLIMLQGQIEQLRKDLEWEKKQRLK